MRGRRAHTSILAGLLLVGCSMRPVTLEDPQDAPNAGQNTEAGDGGSPSAASPSSPAGPSSGTFGTNDASADVPPDECASASKLVYVVSRENTLYSLRPDAVTLTPIGPLTCPAPSGEFPFSMAVDRVGTAWILYTDGVLYKASITDASCVASGYQPNQQGFSLFGMGFASAAPGSSTDVLYVSENVNGDGLGQIDLTTLALHPIGPYGGALGGQRAELTGNSDGDLFGFFLTTPSQVAQIGANGSVATPASLASVNVGTDWAFSYWAGDFYLYTGNSTDPAQSGSAVTRYRPSDGSVTVLSTGVGFFITGAGVSTCAPTTPPPPGPIK